MAKVAQLAKGRSGQAGLRAPDVTTHPRPGVQYKLLVMSRHEAGAQLPQTIFALGIGQ